jgi:hypothetical protein
VRNLVSAPVRTYWSAYKKRECRGLERVWGREGEGEKETKKERLSEWESTTHLERLPAKRAQPFLGCYVSLCTHPDHLE